MAKASICFGSCREGEGESEDDNKDEDENEDWLGM